MARERLTTPRRATVGGGHDLPVDAAGDLPVDAGDDVAVSGAADEVTGAASRRPGALVAAAVVAAVVVALVLLVGVVRPPSLAPLGGPPSGGRDTSGGSAPAATVVAGRPFDAAVAVTTWDPDRCVTVVRADGSRADLRCDAPYGDLLAWTDAGIAVRSWDGDRERVVTLDPASGEVVATEAAPSPTLEDHGVAPEVGPAVPRDGRLEVRHRGRLVWSVETRDPYEVTAGWASPDGRWLALQDRAERLLLVPADGSAPPVVWAEDVPAYATLVWRSHADG